MKKPWPFGKDMAADKKAGIKDGSKKDLMLDKMRGVKQHAAKPPMKKATRGR